MLDAAQTAFELESHRDSMWRVTVHVQLGWALYLGGRPKEARPLLERGAALAPESGQWLNALGASCLLAWVCLDQASAEEAERWARAAVGLVDSERVSDSAASGYAIATLGAVLAQRDDLYEADRLLSSGLDLMRLRPEPLLLIPVLLAYALVRRALGAISDARSFLTEAANLTDSCPDPGSLRDRLSDVRATLALSLDVPIHHKELSLRELDVLSELQRGLSKREVGDRLFLSYNTIHSHTRSIYRKLGVSSRDEAIERARSLGLLQD
jgi:LuxR family maltose regulon positive regulatory protein